MENTKTRMTASEFISRIKRLNKGLIVEDIHMILMLVELDERIKCYSDWPHKTLCLIEGSDFVSKDAYLAKLKTKRDAIATLMEKEIEFAEELWGENNGRMEKNT